MSKKEKAGTLTNVLQTTANDPPDKVMEQLMPLVYDELRAMAGRYLRGERKDHTLQPTALVHEAFLKLVDQTRVDWKGKTHFFAVSASAMRRILIDHARTKGRRKRGGGWQRVLLDQAESKELTEADWLNLSEVLDELAKLDPEQARIVELRFFGELTVEEVAHVLGVSKRKVEADWTHAKAWLRAALAEDANS